MKRLKREFKRYKVGIVAGTVVGLLAANYAISQGYADLNALASAGKGLLDTFMSRSAPLEIAKYKVYGVFAILGAVVGYISDRIVLSFKRRKR